MSFIRYKVFGKKEYAYEVISYWDKSIKKPRQKTRYLGVVVDKGKNIFEKPLKEKIRKEEQILDFGNSFLLHEFLEKEGFIKILKKVFGDNTGMIFTLLTYKLCNPGPMRLAEIWQNGNIIKYLHKVTLSSQRISDLLIEIGEEDVYREFFKKYLSFVRHSSDGLVLDITAIPNQIHMPFTQWGYHDEEIDKQIKLMLVLDKATSLPLFFRYIPGSIADVSTLKPTIEEIKRFGIKNTYFVLDAGFFSEGNVTLLQNEEIQFMIRLPSNRKLYKDLIDKNQDLESIKHAIVYGGRGLFIKKCMVDLFGKNAFAYVILDPDRRGRETRRMLLKLDEEERASKDIDFRLKKKGIMIVISSVELDRDGVLPLYYSRNTAEQLFRFAKDDLELLPLRVHKEESMRGYLLLIFIALIAFLLLKERLGKKITVEEALLSARNLKAKVFNREVVIAEMTKKQREIFEKVEVIVPKVTGI